MITDGPNPVDRGQEIRGQVVHGLRWTASVRLAAQAFTWAVTILVIRYLEKADYGLNSMVSVVVSFLLLFSTAGLQQALVHTRELAEEQIARIFGILIAVNALLCVGLIAATPLVAMFYKEPRVIPLMIVLSFAFLIVPFIAMPLGLLSRDMDFKRRSLSEMAKSVTASVISIVLAVSGFGVWALVWAQVGGMAAQAVFLGAVRPWMRIPRFSTVGVEHLFRFGGLVLLTDVVWMLSWRADVAVGGRVLGPEIMGIYSVGLNLAALPMQKGMPTLHQIAFPAYSRVQDDNAAVGRYYLKSLRLVALVTVPLLFGIAAVSGWAIPLLLGEDWAVAAVPVALIAIVLPLRAVGTLNSPLLNGIGRTRANLSNATVTLLLMTPAFWIGSQYGVIGLCMSWIVAYPIVFAITSRTTLKTLSVSAGRFAESLGPPTAAGFAMLAAVFGVARLIPATTSAVVALIVLIPLGAAVYFGVLRLLFRDRLDEAVELVRTRRSG